MTYEFKCTNKKCNRIVERKLHFYNLPHIIYCSECGSLMEIQISKTNFILKGGGWAKDGYK